MHVTVTTTLAVITLVDMRQAYDFRLLFFRIAILSMGVYSITGDVIITKAIHM